MRVLNGSELFESVEQHNRVHDVFQVLSATDSRGNDSSERFGNDWDDATKTKTEIYQHKI